MNDRKSFTALKIIARLLLAVLIFVSGIFAGYFLRLRMSPFKSAEFDDLFRPFYQAWTIVHQQYLEQPVDDVALMQGAIKGMLESLEDPYSAYLNPDEYRQQNAPLMGEYTGVGAWMDTSGQFLVFISSMPGSPAEAAGIKPGDTVMAIDGEDMSGIPPDLVIKRILGPAGTTVHITVQREGHPDLLKFSIERAVITIPTVEHTLLEQDIGYIRLYSFSLNSAEEFNTALTDLMEQDSQGLIIDLRGNTGGFVDTAVEITSAFLPAGTVLIEEWGDGTRNEYKVSKDVVDYDIPLVLLVDAGSASASEIMAGALQDAERAVLVGTPTFGKGYIQNWIPLTGENGAVRVTIARWLTPQGRQIQGDGLSPDILVELTDADIQAKRDSQLQAALDFLQKNLSGQSASVEED